MGFPDAYIKFLAYFHGPRDYFECHEVLEEYWKESSCSERDSVWVGLIQIAVSLYHHRRGNYKGAMKLVKSALKNIEQNQETIQKLGLNVEKLTELLDNELSKLQRQIPYESINLPLLDEALIRLCEQQCRKMGYRFGAISDLTNTYLMNKHLLRNRSEVINERARQQQLKRRKRNSKRD